MTEESRLDFQTSFLFSKMSRLTVRLTQPPTEIILEALSLGIQQLGHEANYLSPFSTKVKNEWSYAPTSSSFL
jgi:hypothetical protein